MQLQTYTNLPHNEHNLDKFINKLLGQQHFPDHTN